MRVLRLYNIVKSHRFLSSINPVLRTAVTRRDDQGKLILDTGPYLVMPLAGYLMTAIGKVPGEGPRAIREELLTNQEPLLSRVRTHHTEQFELTVGS
jgi:hypothetical protein